MIGGCVTRRFGSCPADLENRAVKTRGKVTGTTARSDTAATDGAAGR